jgi:hypothetical protein
VAVVLTLAGRRIDAPDVAARFPLANVALVRGRLREVFETLQPAAVVCAAACGADLIALELADELGVPGWVVLPFAAELFRSTSVVDRPGDWGPLYDRLVDRAARAERLIAHEMPADDDATYLHANEAILDLAVREAASVENVRALVAWEGTPRAGVDVTYAFAESARRRGIAVVEISTL